MRRIRKPETKKPVTLRLEPSLIAALQELAERKGIGYQTLIREWLKKAVRTGGI